MNAKCRVQRVGVALESAAHVACSFRLAFLLQVTLSMTARQLTLLRQVVSKGFCRCAGNLGLGSLRPKVFESRPVAGSRQRTSHPKKNLNS